jgi:hypothetical protein
VLCVPPAAAFLTGMYPLRLGVQHHQLAPAGERWDDDDDDDDDEEAEEEKKEEKGGEEEATTMTRSQSIVMMMLCTTIMTVMTHDVTRMVLAVDFLCPCDRAAESWGLSSKVTLLPEILKQHSYSTMLLGKWHVGE